jgi:heptosyltransferase-1
VVLPWGNAEERQRAMRLAADSPQARVFDKAPLEDVARLLAHASAVVGVDTGLSHVAAALAIPTVAIYGATDPRLTGVLGPRTTVLQSGFACAPCLKKHCPLKGQDPAIPFEPCYQELAPSLVWGEIQSALGNAPVANLLEQHGN